MRDPRDEQSDLGCTRERGCKAMGKRGYRAGE